MTTLSSRRVRQAPRRAKLLTLTFSLSVALSMAYAPAHAQSETLSINIQAQPLGDALLQLGQQTPLQIFFSQDVVAGRTATAVSGSLAPEDALRQLLNGTGIQYVRNGNNVTLSQPGQGATAQTSQSGVVELAPVAVSAGILGDLAVPYAGGQMATGGSLGLLGSGDVMNTPFSTTNYTSELLYDQQARTLADVVVNDASVRSLTSTGGFGEDFQIRGFPVGSGDVSVNGLYGLVSSSRVPVQILERVEVLKGPGALMRGIPPNGSIGGAINVVTKRADDEPLARTTLTYASESNLTGQLDLGRRFGEDNAWGIRFNGVKRGGEATLRDGKQNLDMGALGLDYRGSRLRWSIDAIHQEDELENIRSQIGWQADVLQLPSPPDGRTNFYPGTRLTQRDSTVMSRLEYDFTDNVTGHIALGYRDGKVRQIFPVTVNPLTGARSSVDADGNFNVMTTFYDSYSKTTSGDTGISARFNTGAIKHRLAVGFTYMEQEAGNAYSTGSAIVASNIYDPVRIADGPSTRLTPQKASDTTLTSIAIADTLSFAHDRVLLTVGARRQTVDVDSFDTTTGVKTSGYRANATSPVAGLVVKPLENVSVYANFTEGLTRGTIVGNTYENRGEVLAPFKSKQYETGVKVDWGTLTTTAALFQIARPAGQANDDNVYGYFGEQRNRGLELSAFGEITRGLRLMASASFMNSELTSTPNGVNQGNRPAGVPASTYNLGLDWDTPWVDGLSLNGRVIRTSSVYLNNQNTLRLPGYTRFDLGARYHTQIAGKDVVFRANVENVADKRYWLASGSFVTNAAGRTYMLSASINY
ncbi:TonB-dependent outer membrane receptor [Bordetella ansorpii]|uniref:TonB-dependent outer membrane receptor n=1 Tax=Bordetella ansorpii TaxID=288768 RepID=A0A157P6E2_9BORD|nr:TonB-dependent receptor [Bordetella ansorpii]SAI28960.1 TonB-dependent outer membrane receptor [Bordetella ansorpii]